MEWIRVSERLPEKVMTDVLVTIPSSTFGGFTVVSCYYNYDGEFAWWDGYNDCEVIVPDVIAWMPFPKPYTEA